MEIIETKIEKIRPDPDQPRTIIDEEDLRGMARSIITEGVINPIEVDASLMIITGERRWRAARIAGLKTVPVKILKIGPEERFMRQVIENLHHNTMNDWDTANALEKLLSLWRRRRDNALVPVSPKTPLSGPGADKGITWLSHTTGKSRKYLTEKLAILGMSDRVKRASKDGKMSGTFFRAINRAPEEFKLAVEKKVMGGEFRTSEDAVEFAAALNRTKNPHVIKKLIDIDYSQYGTKGEVAAVVSKISPRVSERVEKSYEPSQKLGEIIDLLRDWVANNPKEGVGEAHIPKVIIDLNFAKHLIEAWFIGEENKLLKG